MKPVVTIIGRPNVGKSTLFNRLTGTRHALVANTPGVTRDRRMGDASIADLEFIITDTAGLEEADPDSLEGRMTAQTIQAIADSDIIVMMVDGRAGLVPLDEHFAQLVRESGKPVVLAINKVEGKSIDEAAVDAYALGFDDMVAISAEHGQGMGDLYDSILKHMKDVEAEAEKEAEEIIHIAVVGRPNVGKSTFINHLLGEDRLLTGPEAGITRDSIAVPFEYKGQTLKLVDTAGMRKKSRVMRDQLEIMAVNDTRRAIQYAHVVVLMVDATQALEKQDNQIAAMLHEEGRAVILAVNKWDLVPHDEREDVLDEINYQIGKVMPHFRGLPIVTLSAEQGKSIDKVIKACLDIYEIWNKRVSTSALNRWLEDTLQRHTPPLMNGKRLKIKYMTQAKTRPPSFALFVNHKGGIPKSYERYLINGIRETFGLPGVPIRILIRRGKNPYDKDDK